VQLGRAAVWEDDEKHGEIPFGAKMMVVDGVERPLLELRSIQWNAREKESGDAPA
jgi:protein involved in temperature-dependent protein secretion